MIVRTIAPEGMPRPTGEEGYALLDLIWAHFFDSRSWPTFDDVDRKLYATGVNYEDAVQQLCPALLRGISSDISRAPQGADPLSLTVAGAANCNDAGPAIDVFLQMVRKAAANEPHFRPREPGEQPQLLPEHLPNDVKTLTWQRLVFTFAAAALGQHEPCFRGGTLNGGDKHWTLTYDRGIRPFAGVHRVEDYWRVREQVVGSMRVSTERLPFSKEPEMIRLGAWPPGTPATSAPAEESPKALSVECVLHPLITKVAVERYNAGAYGDAVRSAFQEVEHRVQTLLGSHEVGERLMGMALGKPPKITVTRSTGGSLESEQNGMMFLFKGAVGALRNPRSHGPDAKDDRDEADEMLAFASFLMRRLDIEDEKRKNAAAAAAPTSAP